MSNHIVMEYSEITPHITVGTNLCCESHVDKLRSVGAQVDISLEYEHTDIPKMFDTFIWLPVPDHQAPTMEQLDVGTAVLLEAEAKGYVAYVHCKNGHGRSPTLVAAYFIRKGKTAAEAVAAVKERRPEIDPTEAQIHRLEEYAQRRQS